MKKNGIYFTKQQETEEVQEQSLRRKGIVTGLIFMALTIAAVAVLIIVRTKGEANLIVFLLALAVIATCIEVWFANPGKKSYSLLKKILYKQ